MSDENKSGSQSYVPVPQVALHGTNTHPDTELYPLDEEFELQTVDSLDFENQSIQDNEVNAEGQSGMKGAFMNMANSILGAGIIGQPFAFKNCGLVGGLVVMVFLTFLVDWTLRLIVINAQLAKTKSYQDTVGKCYGQTGRYILLLSISLFAVGGCMAFSVIIGDTIPHVLKAFIPDSITNDDSPVGWIFKRNTIIILSITCISYPLSLNRDISKLEKASGFALIGMVTIVIITAVRGPFAGNDLKKKLTKLEWTVNYNIFQGISVISFALVCHHNTIFIYNSLRNATVKKFSKITHIACGISMVCCTFMAVNGLINFGDNTKGNLLNNFRSTDNWINVARFCFGLNMLTTFPLELIVARDVLKDLVLAWNGEAGEHGSTAHLQLSPKQHFAITTVLVFSSMSVALLTCNLGVILELIGATSASIMSYIFPPLCYLKLSWDSFNFKNESDTDKRKFIFWKILPSVGCITFGFSVMIISSYMSIKTSINNKDASHCVGD
ncbi:uncharacterized protein PRCAT00006082001 [Priceomyces carsonii]|uniref:uncharacterized protein n=1 Tax=Priceomyces carsonii TaxID=28549 RepID=UPI002ED908DD|nr:unnamed protein product [Priceomyces carsonii]